jgi:hypothetical protein
LHSTGLLAGEHFMRRDVSVRSSRIDNEGLPRHERRGVDGQEHQRSVELGSG